MLQFLEPSLIINLLPLERLIANSHRLTRVGRCELATIDRPSLTVLRNFLQGEKAHETGDRLDSVRPR